MSWKDRVRGSVELTSPSGAQFSALWVGNTRSIEKTLGVFKFPKIAGAVVQDLDTGATLYPLTLYFDGEDHDTESDRFFAACSESGAWSVVHPVRGALRLYLVSVAEEIEPVTSGGVTKFNTEWITALDEEEPESPQAMAAEVEERADEINAAAAEQFAKVPDAGSPTLKSALSAITTTVSDTLAPLYKTSADLNARVESIKRGLTDTLSSATLDVAGVAGQIRNLIQLPAAVSDDLESRVSAYGSMLSALLDFDSGGDRGVTYARELSLSSAVVSFATIATTSSPRTRAEAIELAETVSANFSALTDRLDDEQAGYLGNFIDEQYFSQSASFYSAAYTIALAARFLLASSVGLAKEKRFTLAKDTAPVMIAIEEYGNDSYLDLFLDTNALKGNDILLLDAGREVVVYV